MPLQRFLLNRKLIGPFLFIVCVHGNTHSGASWSVETFEIVVVCDSEFINCFEHGELVGRHGWRLGRVNSPSEP